MGKFMPGLVFFHKSEIRKFTSEKSILHPKQKIVRGR
jgi:hypothetical protein